jgi:hypothetical protein
MDYQETDIESEIKLDSENGTQKKNCFVPTAPTPPGVVQGLSFSIKADPDHLPMSGTILIGAFTEAEVKKDVAAKSTSVGQTPTQKCELSAKELSQTVVITLGSTVPNASRIILFSAFLSILFFAVALSRFWKHRTEPMGASQWSFSSSAATNITFLGTVLGTVIASSALPDYPHYMTKQGYIVASLLFSIMAGLAPILYNFLCEPSGDGATDPQQLNLRGSVLLFLLADTLTIWAALGQLATIALLFAEFAARLLVPIIAQYLAWTIGGAVGCSLVVFCFRIAGYYAKEHPIRTAATDSTVKRLDATTSVHTQPPRWNVL